MDPPPSFDARSIAFLGPADYEVLLESLISPSIEYPCSFCPCCSWQARFLAYSSIFQQFYSSLCLSRIGTASFLYPLSFLIFYISMTLSLSLHCFYTACITCKAIHLPLSLTLLSLLSPLQCAISSLLALLSESVNQDIKPLTSTHPPIHPSNPTTTSLIHFQKLSQGRYLNSIRLDFVLISISTFTLIKNIRTPFPPTNNRLPICIPLDRTITLLSSPSLLTDPKFPIPTFLQTNRLVLTSNPTDS